MSNNATITESVQPKHATKNGEQLSIEQMQQLALKVLGVLEGVNVLACEFVLQQAKLILSNLAYVQNSINETSNHHS